MAIVTIAGFAIQQTLQILDPFIESCVRNCALLREGSLQWLDRSDAKKFVMMILGTALGIITVLITHVRTLTLLDANWDGIGDVLVTGLAIGGGTEGANTLLKYFGYVKEARKQSLDGGVTVTITSPAVAVTHGHQFQLTANVTNAPQQAIWEVLDPGGGTIDAATGLYTAPANPGTYRISATSPYDATHPTITQITVM